MSLEALTALASVGTLLVLGAAAIAAIVQLTHLRASNQLNALVNIGNTFFNPEILSVAAFVTMDLKKKLADPEFRKGLDIGPMDARVHREIVLAILYDQIGVFLKKGLIAEDVLMEWSGAVYLRYWQLLEDVVAILRRRRPNYLENFEYLAARAKLWVDRHPHGTYPANTPRMSITDRWLETDHAAPPPTT